MNINSGMGSQYTSDLFEKTLSKYNIKHSYLKKGCPGDNARIESFPFSSEAGICSFSEF